MMEIGGVEVSALVKEYQTPLYVYDEGMMKKVIDEYLTSFKSDKFETEVLFASKALDCLYMYGLAKKCGLSLDVVSGGELYGAHKVAYDMSKVYFHGNNKTKDEIEQALEYGVKTIVVDNLEEIKLLKAIIEKTDKMVDILMRINVGVSAHTHQYVITSHPDSKFGFFIESSDIKEAIEMIKESKNLVFKGFHSHIGSQIFDVQGFMVAIEKLFDLMKKMEISFEYLNLGGGFGIKYTNVDKPIPFKDICKILVEKCEKEIARTKINIKKVLIEPGRSIVGESGYTLYTIGQTKRTKNKLYYFIDGGMSDNIRPALYQSLYACDIANRLGEEKVNKVSIAGKCCESGDVIIEDVMLPKANAGDYLVVYSTGAYGYSMSSNYNKMLKPAMVFVDNGKVKVASSRQTYEDLYQNEFFEA